MNKIHTDGPGFFTAVETENRIIDAAGFDAEFDDGTEVEYPVSESLYNYTHTRYGTPLTRQWDDVNDAVEEAYESGWTGLGAVLGGGGQFVEAEATTNDYGSGRYGGGHLCELVLMESNARSIKHMLEEINARFFEHAGIFFYDMGHTATVDLVTQIERGLSDYPLVDEMDHSELEQVTREKMFAEELPSLDSSVNEDDVWVAWIDQEASYCPECGTGDSVEEILTEQGYEECSDCDDFFDPDHEDTTTYQCTDCAHSLDKAVNSIRRHYGYNPLTGEGMVVRIYGDTYLMKNGQWVPHTVYRDDHIIGG